jgi:excisionase family DNA binding protein
MGFKPMTENATATDCGKPGVQGFHTVKETASYLRLCEKQVRRLIWSGELVAYRFGTALRIKREDIAAYAEARRIPLHVQTETE